MAEADNIWWLVRMQGFEAMIIDHESGKPEAEPIEAMEPREAMTLSLRTGLAWRPHRRIRRQR